MLKTHDDFTKALSLTVEIGEMNAKIQHWLLEPVGRSKRAAELSTISDTLEDKTYDLFQLLRLST